MSQGKSIFSNPSSSNGEAPANPFASLGASKASSPFSAAESATPAAAASCYLLPGGTEHSVSLTQREGEGLP